MCLEKYIKWVSSLLQEKGMKRFETFLITTPLQIDIFPRHLNCINTTLYILRLYSFTKKIYMTLYPTFMTSYFMASLKLSDSVNAKIISVGLSSTARRTGHGLMECFPV